MEVVFLPLELRGGVDLASADLCYRHLHIVHPLHHLCISGERSCEKQARLQHGKPCVVHLLDEGVVLLPERHAEAGFLSSHCTSVPLLLPPNLLYVVLLLPPAAAGVPRAAGDPVLSTLLLSLL